VRFWPKPAPTTRLDLRIYVFEDRPPWWRRFLPVRYSHYRALGEANRELQSKVTSQQRALAKLGHARRETIYDCARIVHELGVVRSRVHRPRVGGRIVAQVELADELIYYTFRRDGVFREVVASMLETELLRNPELADSVRSQLRSSSLSFDPPEHPRP
jgi:hypothetical protein